MKLDRLVAAALGAALAVGAVIGALELTRAQQDPDASIEVRIVAQRLADGRTEFGLQQREQDGQWSSRYIPVRRYLPASPPVGRWLTSSAVPLSVLPSQHTVSGWPGFGNFPPVGQYWLRDAGHGNFEAGVSLFGALDPEVWHDANWSHVWLGIVCDLGYLQRLRIETQGGYYRPSTPGWQWHDAAADQATATFSHTRGGSGSTHVLKLVALNADHLQTTEDRRGYYPVPAGQVDAFFDDVKRYSWLTISYYRPQFDFTERATFDLRGMKQTPVWAELSGCTEKAQ